MTDIAEQDTSGSAKFVMHRPSYTPSERLANIRAKQLRDGIKAHAVVPKVAIPIAAIEKAEVVPVKRTPRFNWMPCTCDFCSGVPAQKSPPKITVDLIQLVTAARFGMTADILKSSDRRAATVYPRHIAMYLCRSLTKRSFPEIGRQFGDRDHTSVVHAVQKIEKKRQFDSLTDDHVRSLLALLEAKRS